MDYHVLRESERVASEKFVGEIAAVSMWGSLLFILLQVLIWIPLVATLPEMGILTKEHSEIVTPIALAVIELFAALFLTIFVLVRWMITREVRSSAVIVMVLSALSSWFLLGSSLQGDGGCPKHNPALTSLTWMLILVGFLVQLRQGFGKQVE